MSIKLTVVHRMDVNNVGDMASNPLQYFLKDDKYKVIDITKLHHDYFDDDLPLVLGGGGLFGNTLFGDEYIRELLCSSDRLQVEQLYSNSWKPKNDCYREVFEEFQQKYQRLVAELLENIKTPTAPRFVWGAGNNSSTNTTDPTKLVWPKALAGYQLVGIRDYGTEYSWVPCASCMHPALSKTYSIKNDIIFFEHKKQLIKSSDFGNESIPRFINSGSNVEQTIELLGSANIILTNSYHGAYWGTLLGKKVILVGGPWSNKFNFFKHSVPMVIKKDDWRDALDKSIIYTDALDECRSVTKWWWENIKSCL